ncbi:MAG: RibD family protein, partial [Lachnospiraceae bacterium]|nr:RibD family protein [Lachnospiraceae bacterium]
MNRPYVICHMTMSIDGKVTGDFLYRKECEAATEEYYRLNREIPAEAFACGRVTMEGSFTGGWYPDLTEFEGKPVNREDYIANAGADRYAVSFDRRGKLGWKTATIVDEDPGYGGAHIVEVLCENAPDAYLAYLQSIGVSYIFAGKEEMDLELALKKLLGKFGIKTLLLEGGSEINGAFERAGLVDELSLVQVPVIAGGESKPLFENSEISDFVVKGTEILDGGAERISWRYCARTHQTHTWHIYRALEFPI